MNHKYLNNKINIVLSYGYSDEENNALQDKLPQNCELLNVTDFFTDVLAVPSIYQFVNPSALTDEEMHLLMQCAVELSEDNYDE